jgi:hypothetical protein
MSEAMAFHCQNSRNSRPTIAIQTANNKQQPVSQQFFICHFSSNTCPVIVGKWQAIVNILPTN